MNNIAYLALDSLDSLDTPVSANEDSSLVQTVSISPSPQNNIEPTRSGSHNIFFSGCNFSHVSSNGYFIQSNLSSKKKP